MGTLFSKQTQIPKDTLLPIKRYEVLADGTPPTPAPLPPQGICSHNVVASAYLWGIL